MGSSVIRTIEQLFQVLDYMYRDDLQFVEDYRLVLLGSSVIQTIEQLFQVLDYMYRDDLKFVEDYMLVLWATLWYRR